MNLNPLKIYHILCTERTGSTLLYEYLINFNFNNFKNTKRPESVLNGEIFRPDTEPLENSFRYVYNQLNTYDTHIIIKFMPYHIQDDIYKDIFTSFYDNELYCFLRLQRKDKLRQLLSYLIAVYCHYDNIKIHEFTKSKKQIPFDNKIINEINNFKSKLEIFDEFEMENCEELYYEDFISEIKLLNQGSYNYVYDNFSKINYEEKFEEIENLKENFYNEI